MAKKFGKFLLFTAAVGAVGAAAYYYMQKKDSAYFDETDEDYDDFSEDMDGNDPARTYVPLNADNAPAPAPSADVQAKEPSDDDFFTPLTEQAPKVTEAAKNDPAEAVEEFFDESAPEKAESSEDFFDDDEL
ncbi:MAG: hypothetical protein NC092_06750 [Butyrivibrio sp.]|nr:hypothetical protein [Muribaculum sp.]MCM1552374.1 hypothetical protein [Butyrivibrio sp.]